MGSLLFIFVHLRPNTNSQPKLLNDMNTKILLGIFFFVITCGLSSCQNEAEIFLFSGSGPITEPGACTNRISSSTFFLNSSSGQSQDIGIANGKGGYSATSADESIVTATVSDDRLMLTSHGKKGNTIVTVRDKKDNTVSLPVTVGYGVVTLYSKGQYFAVVDADNNRLADEVLQAKVKEAMASYSFIQDKGQCILQPADVTRYFLPEDHGTFVVKNANGTKTIEGTYRIEAEDQSLNQRLGKFIFTYNNETHTFRLTPPSSSSSDMNRATRDTGPIPFYLIEDVTTFPLLSSVTLPENAKVLYGLSVYLHTPGVKLMD